MVDLLTTHADQLKRLCDRFGVSRLDVFGSATSTAFDAQRSDIDLIVAFRSTDPVTVKRAYFGLLEELERLLGRPVDLLTDRSIQNPLFLQEANASRRNLYAA